MCVSEGPSDAGGASLRSEPSVSTGRATEAAGEPGSPMVTRSFFVVQPARAVASPAVSMRMRLFIAGGKGRKGRERVRRGRFMLLATTRLTKRGSRVQAGTELSQEDPLRAETQAVDWSRSRRSSGVKPRTGARCVAVPARAGDLHDVCAQRVLRGTATLRALIPATQTVGWCCGTGVLTGRLHSRRGWSSGVVSLIPGRTHAASLHARRRT